MSLENRSGSRWEEKSNHEKWEETEERNRGGCDQNILRTCM